MSEFGKGPEWRQSEEFVFGDLGYLLRWSVQDHWANVVAHCITGHSESGVKLYGLDFNEAVPPDDDAELAGYVKWDGCSELDQGCPHWCGPHDYKMRIALLTYIYRRAHELMGREQFDEWDAVEMPAP